MNELMRHDERDAQIADLKEENRNLRAALARANAETAQATTDAARALGALRRQLGPLYSALQMVFGELDSAGVSDAGPSAPSNDRTKAVWDSWKGKMGAAAKVIDALLLHGEMNTQQLAIACGVDRTTIPAYVMKLNKAGLINKNGGRFSLKQL